MTVRRCSLRHIAHLTQESRTFLSMTRAHRCGEAAFFPVSAGMRMRLQLSRNCAVKS